MYIRKSCDFSEIFKNVFLFKNVKIVFFIFPCLNKRARKGHFGSFILKVKFGFSTQLDPKKSILRYKSEKKLKFWAKISRFGC